jgi:hypothetical protein
MTYALTGKTADPSIQHMETAPYKDGLPTMAVYDRNTDGKISEGDNYV